MEFLGEELSAPPEGCTDPLLCSAAVLGIRGTAEQQADTLRAACPGITEDQIAAERLRSCLPVLDRMALPADCGVDCTVLQLRAVLKK